MVNAELADTLPLPQRIALSYAPVATRALTLGLFALDARLGAVLQRQPEPIAAQLRFAWWRERLESAPAQWPKGEPLLSALTAWRMPARLAALPEAWEQLVSEQVTENVVAQFVEGRAAAFAALAGELGAEEGAASAAAKVWAAADLAANLSDEAEREAAIAYGSRLAPPPPLPRALRPLAVLAALGRAALRRGGGTLMAGRTSALIALRAGLTGR